MAVPVQYNPQYKGESFWTFANSAQSIPGGGVALGPDTKVRLSGPGGVVGSPGNMPFFSATTGTVRELADRVETSDTDTGQIVVVAGGIAAGGFYKKKHKGGLAALEIDLEAQRDVNDQNTGLGVYHIAPMWIRAGTYVTIVLFPFGFDFDYYMVPYFLVEQWESNFTVRGSEPQRFSLRGVSSGKYKMLGETDAF